MRTNSKIFNTMTETESTFKNQEQNQKDFIIRQQQRNKRNNDNHKNSTEKSK